MVVQWDARTGKRLREFSGHSFDIPAIAASSDGTKLFTCGYRVCKMWALDGDSNPTVKQTPNGFNAEIAIDMSPDGKLLASRSAVWSVDTGKLEFQFEPQDVTEVAFSPDGANLVAAGPRATRVYDVTTHRLLADQPTVGEGRHDYVRAIDFLPDGKTIVTAEGEEIVLRDLRTAKQQHVISGHTNVVYDVKSVEGGSKLASLGLDGTIRIWDLESRKQLAQFSIEPLGMSLVVFDDGQRIGCRAKDGRTMVWDVATRERTSVVSKGNSLSGSDLAVTPDGKTAAAPLQWNQPGLAMLNVATGEPLVEFPMSDDSHVEFVRFSRDGSSLLAITSDDKIWTWQAKR